MVKDDHYSLLELHVWTNVYEDLQDLLELKKNKDALFIIGDWNAKAGSQENPESQATLALEYKMKQSKG